MINIIKTVEPASIITLAIHFFMLFLTTAILYKKALSDRYFNRAVKLLLLVFFVYYLWYIFTRSLEGDELEHIQSSWLVYNGEIPYFDFFQHHHPLLWYLFSPVIGIAGQGIFSVLLFRFLNFLFLTGILFYVFLISKEISKSEKVAWVSVSLLFSINIFSQNAASVRPDVLMTFLLIVSYYYFIRFWNTAKNVYLVACGLLMALAFITLQKAAFYIFPFFMGVLLFLILKKISVKQVFILAGSSLIPLLLFLGIYWQTGFFKEYIVFNWLYNFQERAESPVSKLFSNPVNVIISINFIGLLVFTVFQILKRFQKVPILFRFNFFVGLFGGLIISILSTVYLHYFILVIPFLIITSAYLLVQFFEKYKVKPGLQCCFLFALYIFTLPVTAKPALEFTIFEQLHDNHEIIRNNTFIARDVKEDISLIFAKYDEYPFYQTHPVDEVSSNLKKVVNNNKYRYFITEKMKRESEVTTKNGE